MAVVAPIPRARVMMAVAVNPGAKICEHWVSFAGWESFTGDTEARGMPFLFQKYPQEKRG